MFIKQFDEFDFIVKKYIVEIIIMSKQYVVNEIKVIEKKEGKFIKYYIFLMMQEVEMFNDVVVDVFFDVVVVSKQFVDFEEYIQQFGDKIKVDMDKYQYFSGFIDCLEKFQGKVKKCIWCVCDNVVYIVYEQDYFNSGSGDMVDGFYEVVVKVYNEFINIYNSYYFECEF